MLNCFVHFIGFVCGHWLVLSSNYPQRKSALEQWVPARLDKVIIDQATEIPADRNIIYPRLGADRFSQNRRQLNADRLNCPTISFIIFPFMHFCVRLITS